MEKIREAISFHPVDIDWEYICKITPALRMLLMKEQRSSILVFKTNNLVKKYTESRENFAALLKIVNLKSDYIIDLEPVLLFKKSNSDEQIREFQSAFANNPKLNIIAIQELGIFAWGYNKYSADTRMSLMLDLIRIAEYNRQFPHDNINLDRIFCSLAENCAKPDTNIDDIDPAVRDKIILITGSAQGIGKGIAERLLQKGANVIMADINKEQAEKNIVLFKQKYSPGKSLAVYADMTKQESVEQMIRETVTEYGGLDVLISNAGILRAGSVEDLDLETFQLTTRVNYTAFFIGTKYAAGIFKIQNKYAADASEHFTDIIQINSKSGLAGSKKNFAYAGSKFGSIGLVQSFALELIEHNIKVNAICPGNFFEGPLWSDPETGLFVQYLKTNKVPGAKTIADVRRAYEEKVPMKRGCRIEDIVRAVIYIINQKYETGQALPVTGGQIMLN